MRKQKNFAEKTVLVGLSGDSVPLCLIEFKHQAEEANEEQATVKTRNCKDSPVQMTNDKTRRHCLETVQLKI